LLSFLLDHFAATGDSGDKVVNIAFVHFALALMVFLALQVLCQIIEEHLIYNWFTVILLLSGSSSGSMSIFRTL